MSGVVNQLLEKILLEAGGLGRFQFIIISVINLGKFPMAWSVMMMTFGGATPDWWCHDHRNSSISKENKNIDNETVGTSIFKMCKVNGSESCTSVHFDPDMNTIINEWQLVCSARWVSGVIISIQMAGLLISGYLSGQLSDMFGRRLILFVSFILNGVTNIVAAFSNSWQMFAGLRFVIGISAGLYLAIYLTYLIEFVPKGHRPMVQAIPSWSLAAALYGLLAWRIPDWRHIQILIGVSALPFAVCVWFIVPESFRWLVSHKKIDEAKMVVNRIAKINKVAPPALQEVESALEKSHTIDRKYTVVDICKHRYLLKRAIVVSYAWMAMAYTYYGISFGVDKLSGSLYINIFVLSILEIPGSFLAWFFMIKIGRRWSYMIFSLLSAAGGLAVGLAENYDFDNSGTVINGFAFVAKLGCAIAWSCVFIITTECYPTVLRTTGYGLASSLCRIGPILAPLSLSVSATYKGFLYFSCGAVTLVSGLSIFFIPETKDSALEDLIGTDQTSTQVTKKDSQILINTSNDP